MLPLSLTAAWQKLLDGQPGGQVGRGDGRTLDQVGPLCNNKIQVSYIVTLGLTGRLIAPAEFTGPALSPSQFVKEARWRYP